MKDIVIRITANKREVGILKNSFEQKANLSIPEANDEPKRTCDNKRSFTSLKFKCFEKYKHFKENPDLIDNKIQSRPLSKLNKEGVRIIIEGKACISRDVSRIVGGRKSLCLDSVSGNANCDSKTNFKPGLIKLEKGDTLEVSHSVERVGKKCSNYLELKHSSSYYKKMKRILQNRRLQQERQESKSKRKHPNRRLEQERPESESERKHPNRRLEQERVESESERKHPNRRLEQERVESESERKHPNRRLEQERVESELEGKHPNRRLEQERVESESERKHPNRRLEQERVESELGRKHPNRRLEQERVESESERKRPNRRLEQERVESELERKHPNRRLQRERPQSESERNHPNRRLEQEKVESESERNHPNRRLEQDRVDSEPERKHPNRRLEQERVESESERKHPNRRLEQERVESELEREHPNRRLQRERPQSESKRKHPNRRLQRERPDSDLPAKKCRYSRPRSVIVPLVSKEDPQELSVSECSQWKSILIKEEPDIKPLIEVKSEQVEEIKSEKNVNVASMWGKVFDSPHLGDEESIYIKEVYGPSDTESDNSESTVDYEDLLKEFVIRKLDKSKYGGKTLYEKRVEKMMKDPNCADIIKEFYIPPALVEVLFNQMTQDRTAQESLKRICTLKKWPKPEYTCRSVGKHGFLCSCSLKTKTFAPSRPASNEDLAKELAALECLEWLGFNQRSLDNLSIEETYFP